MRRPIGPVRGAAATVSTLVLALVFTLMSVLVSAPMSGSGVSPFSVPAAMAQVPCQDTEPSGAEDMNAGWWAEFMHLRELHSRASDLGAGVTVAVLDTGTGETVQLANAAKRTPIDLTTGSPLPVTGMENFTLDCDGHGTAVAGLIAAQPASNTPVPEGGFDSDMVGVAPNVELLTIRVAAGLEQGGDSDDLAAGIESAVEAGADIVNVSIEMGNPYGPLEDAVAFAEQAGVLVVAAAGNHGARAWPAAYAAKYENVISVGSVGRSGAASEFSSPSATTIAAPGEGIVSTNRNLGHVADLQGTSFAAPLVTGVAALMMNRYDGITPTEIRARMVATADPVAGQGPDSPLTGAGVINPVAALTAIVDLEQASQRLRVPPYPGRHVPPPPDHTVRNTALTITGAVFLITTVALAALATVRRARTRGWRPGS